MVKNMLKSRLGVCLCAVLFAFVGVVPAHASSPSGAGQAGVPAITNGAYHGMCQVLWVHLRGSLPSRNECMDGLPRQSNPNRVGTYIYKDSGCGGNSLWIFQDSNFSGLEICFDGAGSVNMGNYTTSCNFGVCASWNDNASSWSAGCSNGTFWINANESGQAYDFAAWSANNFDGQYDSSNHEYRLPNNSLSSLTLYSNC